ncbi:hypothetical protein GQ600_23549 [Phytophthora cactorum]|nr:hypothetical protein GQ600_23549 [Phytophthora cactorum]
MTPIELKFDKKTAAKDAITPVYCAKKGLIIAKMAPESSIADDLPAGRCEECGDDAHTWTACCWNTSR